MPAPPATVRAPVLSIHRSLPAWRGLVPLVRGAKGVLELPAGTIDATGTSVGDLVLIEEPEALDAPEDRLVRPAQRARRHDPRLARSPHAGPSILPCPRAASVAAREGPPLCGRCEPALDARLELPAGIPIGLPADIPELLLQLEWCAPFAGSVRRALHELKYGGERRLAEPLGRAIARRWRRAGAGGDVLVPVPVHAERARKRGYDQAALIAAVAARDLRLPMAPILERGRATIAQFDLDRQHRATNVAGAFRLRPGATGPAPSRAAGSSSSTTS